MNVNQPLNQPQYVGATSKANAGSLKTSIEQPVIQDVNNMAAGAAERLQPQPYPLQGQALATGWGQYPQGAYYPPPV